MRNGEQLNGKALLLNQNNQLLFPNVKIYDVEPAGQTLKELYKIKYDMDNSGHSQVVYMDKYGRVYSDRGL